eukprot:607438-Amphidinium_carterae.5
MQQWNPLVDGMQYMLRCRHRQPLQYGAEVSKRALVVATPLSFAIFACDKIFTCKWDEGSAAETTFVYMYRR